MPLYCNTMHAEHWVLHPYEDQLSRARAHVHTHVHTHTAYSGCIPISWSFFLPAGALIPAHVSI